MDLQCFKELITPMLTGNISDITLPKKGSHNKQKLNKLVVRKL